MIGEAGTAKTHCLRRIAKYLNAASFLAWERGYWPRPFSVSYIDWSDIAFQDREDEDMTFREALDCDVLLLDDIGTEVDKFKTGEAKERLRILLSTREPKWSAISTNIQISKWAEFWDQRVEDRLLRGNARPFTLDGVPTFASIS